MREVIWQRYVLMTASLVNIIGDSPHSWPEKRYSRSTICYSIYMRLFANQKLESVIKVKYIIVIVSKCFKHNNQV